MQQIHTQFTSFQQPILSFSGLRTIIAGSRSAELINVINAIDSAEFKDQISVIISGTAKGADYYGEVYAKAAGIPIERFPADWDKYGKRAGYLRNVQMANAADALIAVWDGASKGTNHMINIANEKNLLVFVYKFIPE